MSDMPLPPHRFGIGTVYEPLFLQLTIPKRCGGTALQGRIGQTITKYQVQSAKYKVPSLCVLDCLHQSRQCVFGVAVEHAGHRLEKEGIFEAGETFTLSSFENDH